MGKKILLVDDEPTFLFVLGAELRAMGYDVLSAMDGLTAIDMARKEKPDLIVLDLMLPKMDGYKVCGLLKKDARYAKIPIILFSARSREEDRILGEEVGANAYVTKRFEPQLILGKIRELMTQSVA